MKRISILLTILLAAAGLIAAVAAQAPPPGARQPATASAAPAAGFTYQGVLTDGSSPANGSYDMQFALFDAETDGIQAGGTLTHTDVAVADGLFTVNLDFGAAALAGGPRFLEVRVWNGSAYETLLPRQPIRPAPIATTLAAEMAPPAVVTATAVSGGSLPSGAYYFKIVAAGGGGATVGSAEAACTVDGVTTNLCRLDWTAVSGATAYRVYKGSTPGGQDRYQTSTDTTHDYVSDVGATLGAVPTTTTAFVNHISPTGDSWLLGGSIGISTTEPAAEIHIGGDGSMLFGPNLGHGAFLEIGGSSTSHASVTASNGDLHLNSRDGSYATYLNWRNRNPTIIGGSLGIGTVPGAALHVNGDGTALFGPNSSWGAYLLVGGNSADPTYASVSTSNGDLHLNSAAGPYRTYIGWHHQNDTIINPFTGNVGIGTGNPAAKLHVIGNILSSGNIGVHTLTPQHPLDVDGAARVGYLYVLPQDAANNEGGEITLHGPTPALDFGIDNLAGAFRIIQGGATLAYHSQTYSIVYQPLGIQAVPVSATFQVGTNGDGTYARANQWLDFLTPPSAARFVPLTEPLTTLAHLTGLWVMPESGEQPLPGFRVEDVQAVLPELVHTDANGVSAMDYGRLTPLLVEAIKAQQAQLDALQADVAQLQARQAPAADAVLARTAGPIRPTAALGDPVTAQVASMQTQLDALQMRLDADARRARRLGAAGWLLAGLLLLGRGVTAVHAWRKRP